MSAPITVHGVEMPSTFWTADRLADFWGYVRWLGQYNMPIIMIVIAALVVEMVLLGIIEIPFVARQSNRRRKDDDDDDDD